MSAKPLPAPRKRSAGAKTNPLSKRPRVGSASSSQTKRRIKNDPGSSTSDQGVSGLKAEFVDMFTNEIFTSKGITNALLKQHFGDKRYLQLVPIINDLTRSGRLSMGKNANNELVFSLVSNQIAAKFVGLDASARLVYQVIEAAGSVGIWTKEIRQKCNILQQKLTKILKTMESRQMVKPVKSVSAKTKILYMLYDLKPAKEITGGPWFTEMEFDSEFINDLRTFIILCTRKMNGGRGVTLAQISDKMSQAKVSRVELNMDEVQQLLQTLAFDYRIEQTSVNSNGEAVFISSRRVTTMCDFRWWDALSPDFHLRDIKFEDGVVLKAHEPHHHTA